MIVVDAFVVFIVVLTAMALVGVYENAPLIYSICCKYIWLS